jgi:ABC-type Na+ efflux pump permease subunit
MRRPLLAIARKEFIQIRRDKATIYMIFIFPMMMLLLYGFGIRYLGPGARDGCTGYSDLFD